MKVEVERYTSNILPVVKNVANRSNLDMAVEMVAQAKLASPFKEGQLRNSINATSLQWEDIGLNDEPDNKLGKPLSSAGLKDGEFYVGSSSDHAVFQEFGTKNIPASPFLRVAEEIVIQKKVISTVMAKYSKEAMANELQLRKVTLKEMEEK